MILTFQKFLNIYYSLSHLRTKFELVYTAPALPNFLKPTKGKLKYKTNSLLTKILVLQMEFCNYNLVSLVIFFNSFQRFLFNLLSQSLLFKFSFCQQLAIPFISVANSKLESYYKIFVLLTVTLSRNGYMDLLKYKDIFV